MPAWFLKATMPVLIGLGMLLLSALLALQAVKIAEDWLETYRTRIITGRDNHWKAEIAKSNLETARTQAAQLQTVIQLESEAQEKLKAVEDQKAELEKLNAALPNGNSCGLDSDRVKLLAR